MKPTRLNSEQLLAFALAHHHAGRLAEAEGIYRQIISTDPANARALDLLGVLCLQTNRVEVAVGWLRRAVAANPTQASYRCNLGSALRRLGEADPAIAEFREAVRLAPDLAVAHNNLGIALAEKVELSEAITAYQRAISLNPTYAEALSNMANALRDVGRIDEALAACRRAIELKPDAAASHNNLGVTLAKSARFTEAIEAYRRALDLQPNYGDAWSNLGNALAAVGRHDEALAAARRAVEMEPELLQSHWNYAVILLRSGDLSAGWREYEWRWKQQTHFPRPSPRYYPPRFPTPHWTGGDISGRTIFLHAEQGFGDTLHFCRYAPLVAERGARVIIEAHPELCRLLRSLPGVQQVIPRGETPPAFDQHCPMMSLPLAFNTTLDTIPAAVPYLRPEEADLARWNLIVCAQEHPEGSALRTDFHDEEKTVRSADPTNPRPLNIGLCWAGSPDHADDHERSLALSQFVPLAHGDLVFHSLQNQGPAAAQAAHPPSGMCLIDHSSRLTDFAETAALIANLDLVITADTAVAHLAGALGKPVWVLLRYLSDWRWLIDRSDTPWYPTMRLFRQQRRGDWEPVLARVAMALSKLSIENPKG